MKNKVPVIICIVMAVVMAVSGVVFFISTGNNKPASPDVTEKPEPVEFVYEQSAYTTSTALSVKGANGEVYLPTDFDNIYYTATLDGKVNFFEYANGQFTASTLAPKQLRTKITASRFSIPVTVNYIEKDGKVCGYGVFTSDMNATIKVYPYAFVKLTMKPVGYGSGYLLLADFNKDNFYKADKLYSEIYNFDLAKGTASTYVSNNTRLIDKNGTFRQDWTILTDDFIGNLGNGKYFLSSRYYNEDDMGKRADIMVLSNAYKPTIAAKDILGIWAINDEHGLHFLRKNDKGFVNVVKTGDKEQVLAQFEGDWAADYLQDGNYLINKKSLVMTDLHTGASQTLKGINIESADIFSVSPDGKKIVFASYGELNANGTPIQSITYCTADGSAEPVTYTEPMLFAEDTGFEWLDNSTVMSVRALAADGKTAGSVAYTF